jgi:uncharacterized membrane protein (UPF0127 family)
MFKSYARSCLLVIGLACAAATVAQTPSSLPTTDLYVGMHRVVAEVAWRPADRATGLMWRDSMPENHGMLFVFQNHAIHCFWMRNTYMALSIAFLRDDGSIVNIEHMQPEQEDNHCPDEPVRFALEVNQGWFDQRHITEGQRVRGLESVTPER